MVDISSPDQTEAAKFSNVVKTLNGIDIPPTPNSDTKRVSTANAFRSDCYLDLVSDNPNKLIIGPGFIADRLKGVSKKDDLPSALEFERTETGGFRLSQIYEFGRQYAVHYSLKRKKVAAFERFTERVRLYPHLLKRLVTEAAGQESSVEIPRNSDMTINFVSPQYTEEHASRSNYASDFAIMQLLPPEKWRKTKYDLWEEFEEKKAA